MADLTTGNINTEAQTAASVNDGDYIYIYKADAGVFSKIEKSLLLQGVSGGSSGGGMSDEVYQAIQGNVEALRLGINSLRNALAGIAFSGARPAEIGEFTWPDSESGDDAPVATPTLNVSISTLIFSTTVGLQTSKTFTLTGNNLTGDISLKVTGVFLLEGTHITGGTGGEYSIASSYANGSNMVTVNYMPVEEGVNTGTVAISSMGATGKTVSLRGTAASGVEGYSVTIDDNGLSHCSLFSAPTIIQVGSPATIVIAAESGYTLNGVTPTVVSTSGTVGTPSYDSANDRISISISGISGDVEITIAASAVSTQPAPAGYVTDGLVLHLDGFNQGDTDGEWKDSAPNVNRTFILADRTGGNDLPTVLPNGVKFTSVNQVGYCNESIGVSYNAGTIEVVFTPESGFLAANRSFFVANTEKHICAMFQKTGSFLVYGTFKTAGQTINAKRALVNTNFFDDATDEPLTVVVSQNGWQSNGEYKGMLVQNGEINSSAPSGTRLAWDTTYSMCIGSSSGVSETGININPAFANATIHEIRIYNKKLTEAEILQNQRYDNYRYDLGLDI